MEAKQLRASGLEIRAEDLGLTKVDDAVATV